ncbi:hypothetical protein CSAL01_13743 [Colletotrichum salicis]|uniref:Uncharacterized protein n=1 Tax=Colletotrichum salicis TaxID=1209931 RepID=A0A135RSM9_9PEZI|nr:hypothetical protein CSAL01_13743 [Colletotrichum salicis]
MAKATYAPSTFSETSTICSFAKESFEKEPAVKAAPTVKERRSLRSRVKRALREVGNPPTYRYDLEHGIETKRTVPVGPMGFNVLNQPSRM